MITASLVFQDKKSNKFWNLEVKGKTYTTSWGRIGTIGQSNTKNFWSEEHCKRSAKNIIATKIKKGYVEAITDELIAELFIMVLSGIAKRRNANEIYYRDDKFNKLATIEFVDGSADYIILRYYYENGKLKSQHEWVDNKQHGQDLGWYEDGKKHWERKFVSGKLTYEKRY